MFLTACRAGEIVGGLWSAFAAGFLFVSEPAPPEFRPAAIFADGLILQRDRPIRVWGMAPPREEVKAEFAGRTQTVEADGYGRWSVEFPPSAASSEPRTLTLRCDDKTVAVRDVRVGEVWLASGQSNMAMNVGEMLRGLPAAREIVPTEPLPAIRFVRIAEPGAAEPRVDLPNRVEWVSAGPETALRFSAAAFVFARELHTALDVPIAVIDTSRGGTPIEPFIPRPAFDAHPTLRAERDLGDREDLAGLKALPGGVWARDANWLPGRLYHTRLAPLERLAVRGAIWYQGESNCGDGEDPREYRHKFAALVNGWRASRPGEDFPVYYVQLPGSGARAAWPYLREEQRLCLTLPRLGMVVTADLDGGDIHPPNKLDVGRRLARWALARDYGKAIPFSGPLFERAEFAGEKAIVHFAHAEDGLRTAAKIGAEPPRFTPDVPPGPFDLADAAGKWHPATAAIAGKTILVSAPAVPQPVAVRYAVRTNPQGCNLYGAAGLPASPFCSDPALMRHDRTE